MNLFRTAIFALSAVLTFSTGPSSSATTSYSHLVFSATDDRTLSLRETGSQIVLETIEDALRQGGAALFGDGFQLDTSLGWVFGETIEGEIDAVVPLWNRGGHVVFTQPGLVFWTGVEEEERADGNLGMVYRAPSASMPSAARPFSMTAIFKRAIHAFPLAPTYREATFMDRQIIITRSAMKRKDAPATWKRLCATWTPALCMKEASCV